ncbi:helix-turn-helix domain-containing protein [Sulfurimonas sp.]|uniref:helix-turn-helix domain-containing protein n=1 Tax=Sulfurimonas sp. TaxID=2022749 RepID=UPI0025DD5298|nr:helix-turn-helix domain-containing protein [Sulfurimonas sp.]
MSIKIMTMVFKDENLDSNKKLIMLAISDNANDEGFCYPSLNTLINKTALSKPTIIKHLKELEQNNFILSKKRNTKQNKKGGGRLSTIYIVYPQIHIPILDEDILFRFDIKKGQSKEALPPSQSKEATPQNDSQSKEALPKPSLSLFNHHLFNKLNKEEKDIFLEYSSLRKKMKLQTTLAIQERLLKKYFEYGRNIEIIQNAISANWRDFYPLRQNNTNVSKQSKPQQNTKSIAEVLIEYVQDRQKGFTQEIATLQAKEKLNWGMHKDLESVIQDKEYEWYMQRRAEQQTKPKESDEDYVNRLMGEM